jgi:hypothetical protein
MDNRIIFEKEIELLELRKNYLNLVSEYQNLLAKNKTTELLYKKEAIESLLLEIDALKQDIALLKKP